MQVVSTDPALRGPITLDIQCPGLCAPPAGDACADAPFFDCNGSVAFENFGAHVEPSDPLFSCRIDTPPGPGQGVGSVWRRFVAPATSAKISLNSSSSTLDTLLAVYSGTCGDLTELACSDDEGDFHLSELAVDGLTVGETYYVQVASLDRFEVGRMVLALQCPNPAPPNDVCGAATELGPLPAFDELNVRRALADTHFCGTNFSTQRGVWYRVTGTGNVLTATTCHEFTNQQRTQISVFCGDCETLECVTGARSGFCVIGGRPGPPSATVSWCSQEGASYLLNVGTDRDDSVGGRRIHFEVVDTGEPCTAEVDCLPTGRCCLLDGTSTDVTADECEALGGLFGGDGTSSTIEVLGDGGFEAGPVVGPWTEASTNFGSPLCEIQRCGFGGGSGPRSGRYWAWFGGTFAFEQSSLEQDLVIPEGSSTLEFHLENPISERQRRGLPARSDRRSDPLRGLRRGIRRTRVTDTSP